jgi:hypothetical protein
MNDAQRPGTVWQSSWEDIPGQPARRVTLSNNGRAVAFGEVLHGWINDETFRACFLAELRLTPFVGFFWELPPLHREALGLPYEHVVLEGNVLEQVSPDPSAFLSVLQADTASDLVASFPNITGDALLVVPRPVAGSAGYGHLGAFLRAASEKQQHALLKTLGQAAEARLQGPGSRLWISTAGLGIPWLHVRLDSRPKYYKHRPYRAP